MLENMLTKLPWLLENVYRISSVIVFDSCLPSPLSVVLGVSSAVSLCDRLRVFARTQCRQRALQISRRPPDRPVSGQGAVWRTVTAPPRRRIGQTVRHRRPAAAAAAAPPPPLHWLDNGDGHTAATAAGPAAAAD